MDGRHWIVGAYTLDSTAGAVPVDARQSANYGADEDRP
ncbi:hypothetical protein NJ7G_1178 [Natrinema sp. J7-2]|nr:hypothetical protein NJ7G_1178 [Natrinema sp. J7-2]